MKLDLRSIIYEFILVLVLCSCSSMYIPSSPNIPLLSKKHETKASAGIGTNSIHILGAYAITKQVAMTINGDLSYGNFGENKDLGDVLWGTDRNWYLTRTGLGNHKSLELGLGLFNTFKNNEKVVYELYGGLGLGNAHEGKYYSKYLTGFLQYNLGVKLTNFEVGGALKLVGGEMTYNYERNTYDGTNTTGFFAPEIGLVVRTGSENIKYYLSPGLQFTHPFPDSFKDSYTNLHISMGCTINLHKKKEGN